MEKKKIGSGRSNVMQILPNKVSTTLHVNATTILTLNDCSCPNDYHNKEKQQRDNKKLLSLIRLEIKLSLPQTTIQTLARVKSARPSPCLLLAKKSQQKTKIFLEKTDEKNFELCTRIDEKKLSRTLSLFACAALHFH